MKAGRTRESREKGRQAVIGVLNKARAMELQAICQHMNQHYGLDGVDSRHNRHEPGERSQGIGRRRRNHHHCGWNSRIRQADIAGCGRPQNSAVSGFRQRKEAT